MSNPVALGISAWCVSAGTLMTLVLKGVLTPEEAQRSLDKDLTAFDNITAALPADDQSIAQVRAMLLSLMAQVRLVRPPPAPPAP